MRIEPIVKTLDGIEQAIQEKDEREALRLVSNLKAFFSEMTAIDPSGSEFQALRDRVISLSQQCYIIAKTIEQRCLKMVNEVETIGDQAKAAAERLAEENGG